MLLLMLHTSAYSAGDTMDAADGFVHVRDVDGCAISARPEAHRDGAAMRAVCDWPDVDAARFGELIRSYERFPEFVFPVALARVERREPDRTLVYQRQHVPGIADREVLLWMSEQTLPDGSSRVMWTTANDQPLSAAPGTIRTPKNNGFWEVAPKASGGSRVIHQIEMDAGGSIPRWLVSLVRNSGFTRLMQQVRAFARGR